MVKKIYESKKTYSKKYNRLQSTIQIERELYNNLKMFLKDKNISIREYVSTLIENSLAD